MFDRLKLSISLDDLILEYRAKHAVDTKLGSNTPAFCEFAIEDMTTFTWEKFERKRNAPMLFANAIPGWKASESWTWDSWRSRFGNISFPFSDSVTVDDCERAPFGNASLDGNRYFLQANRGLYGDLFRHLAEDVVFDRSSFLWNISKQPVLSLGGIGSSNMLHKHREAWQAQVHGLKLWWMVKNTAALRSRVVFPRGKNDPFLHWGRNVCTYLKERPADSASFCIAAPGYAVFVPDNYFHGTCNLDPWTVSFGGEGGESSFGFPGSVYRALVFEDVAAYELLAKARIKELNEDLGLAVESGHLRMVKLLVLKRIDLVEDSVSEEELVNKAIKKGHVAVLKFLVSRMELKWQPGACEVCMAASQATFHSLPMIKYLLKKSKIQVNSKCKCMPGRLIHAATRSFDCSLPSLRLLIDHRADVNLADSQSNILILERDPIKNLPFKLQNGRGLTPMHITAMVGHVSTIEYLAKQGADIHTKLAGGQQPLHIATMNSATDAARELVQMRADVLAKIASGWQPLHIAAAGGSAPLVDLLVKHGANLKAKTREGELAEELCDDSLTCTYLKNISSTNTLSSNRIEL